MEFVINVYDLWGDYVGVLASDGSLANFGDGGTVFWMDPATGVISPNDQLACQLFRESAYDGESYKMKMEML